MRDTKDKRSKYFKNSNNLSVCFYYIPCFFFTCTLSHSHGYFLPFLSNPSTRCSISYIYHLLTEISFPNLTFMDFIRASNMYYHHRTSVLFFVRRNKIKLAFPKESHHTPRYSRVLTLVYY